MSNVQAILNALSISSLSETELLGLIGDKDYLEHRPLEEDIECPNDNWVCFEGKDWFLEFVNDEFVYLAIPYDGDLPKSIHSRLIIRKPVTKDFGVDQYLLIGNRLLFQNPDALPNRFSPIISELMSIF